MRFFTPKAFSLLALAAMTSASLSTATLAQDAAKPAAPFDFAAMDADKDGKLTQAEMDAFRSAQIAAMDTDKDGTISAAELGAHQMARMTQDMQARAENRAKRMMDDLDSDGNGTLSVAEMQAGAPNGARMFGRIDTDEDGAISAAEADAAREKMAQRGERDGKGARGGHRGGRGEGHDDGHGKGGFGGFW